MTPTPQHIAEAELIARDCAEVLYRELYPRIPVEMTAGNAKTISLKLNLPTLLASRDECERLRAASPEMPGAWRCPKCSFTLQKNTLHTGDSSVSADTSPLNEKCPNDGQLMKPLTWREANEDFFQENVKLRTERDELLNISIPLLKTKIDALRTREAALMDVAKAALALDLETTPFDPPSLGRLEKLNQALNAVAKAGVEVK